MQWIKWEDLSAVLVLIGFYAQSRAGQGSWEKVPASELVKLCCWHLAPPCALSPKVGPPKKVFSCSVALPIKCLSGTKNSFQ